MSENKKDELINNVYDFLRDGQVSIAIQRLDEFFRDQRKWVIEFPNHKNLDGAIQNIKNNLIIASNRDDDGTFVIAIWAGKMVIEALENPGKLKESHDRHEDELIDHELKIWHHYFDDLESGRKLFELRKNDRGFKVGDTIRFREYDPNKYIYSGRETTKKIVYILGDNNAGIETGYVILGLESRPSAGLEPLDEEKLGNFIFKLVANDWDEIFSIKVLSGVPGEENPELALSKDLSNAIVKHFAAQTRPSAGGMMWHYNSINRELSRVYIKLGIKLPSDKQEALIREMSQAMIDNFTPVKSSGGKAV